VDRQRDEREPRPEPGAERRQEEHPEARGALEELELPANGEAHGPPERTTAACCGGSSRPRQPAAATRSRSRESASAKKTFSSGVPTVTRIALGAPKPASGRTMTPRRSRSSKTSRASPPTSAYRKFATAGPAGVRP